MFLYITAAYIANLNRRTKHKVWDFGLLARTFEYKILIANDCSQITITVIVVISKQKHLACC